MTYLTLARTQGTRTPLLVWICAAWLLLLDVPRIFSVSGLSLAGLLTLVVGAWALTATLASPLTRRATDARLRRNGVSYPPPALPLTLSAFLFVVLCRTVIGLSSDGLLGNGLQNVAVYSVFVGACTHIAVSATPASIAQTWNVLRRVATIVAYVYFIVVFAAIDIYSARPMGIAALISIAVLLPGQPRSRWEQFAPYFAVAAVALSLSRTATIVAALLLVFLVLRGKTGGRLLRAMALIVAVVASLLILALYYPPFRDRFLVGDNAVQVGGVGISTAGRAAFWEALITRIDDGFWLGQGAGAAERVISITSPGQSHPHNEYLRLFFDFGAIGVSLFIIAILSIGLTVFRNARRHGDPIHWAAGIALLGVSLTAITDNPLVYVFVMLPLGVLLGSSLALGRYQRSLPGPHKPLQRPDGVFLRPLRPTA
jgi:O-antigen ligase